MRELVLKVGGFIFSDQNYEGRPIFAHLDVVWREGDMLYHCSHPTQDFEDLDALVADSSIHVNAFRPKLPSDLVPLSPPLPSDSYRKELGECRGGLHPLEAAARADCALEEVRLWESTLRHHPHPHIVEYRGIVSDDNEHISAIVLKRCDKLLADVRTEVDPEQVMSEVRSAIAHLHSLGLIHGDISHNNVMLDSNGSAILIDFDCCTKEGGARAGGTPGYMKGVDDHVARKEQDLYGLECLEKWLATGRTKVLNPFLKEEAV